MFAYCSSLNNLNLSSFNTKKVTNMSYMFSGCSGLIALDLSKFNTINVTNMNSMFSGCSSLTNIKFPDIFFNSNNVKDMSYMFYNCSSLKNLDLSKFNTDKVTDMQGMFSHCSSLTNLDLYYFNTKKVTDMQYMFANCFQDNATLICQASTIQKITENGDSYLTITNDNKNNDEIKKTINTVENQYKVYTCSVKRGGNKPEITKVEEYQPHQ